MKFYISIWGLKSRNFSLVLEPFPTEVWKILTTVINNNKLGYKQNK